MVGAERARVRLADSTHLILLGTFHGAGRGLFGNGRGPYGGDSRFSNS